MTEYGENWAILNPTTPCNESTFACLGIETSCLHSVFLASFHATFFFFVLFYPRLRRIRVKHFFYNQHSSWNHQQLLIELAAPFFKKPLRSQFKGDWRAHADSCPLRLLRPWWERRIIKLLTTGEERQEWLDVSQSNSHHLLRNRCNALRCDFDYKGVKLGSHHWTLLSALRALLLMSRCGLQHFSLPSLFSVPFLLLGWLKFALWSRKTRDEMKSAH